MRRQGGPALGQWGASPAKSIKSGLSLSVCGFTLLTNIPPYGLCLPRHTNRELGVVSSKPLSTAGLVVISAHIPEIMSRKYFGNAC